MDGKTLHRSDNLWLGLTPDRKRIEVEIRFPTSATRGSFEAACPRCGEPGEPAHWELEGPDVTGNNVWMRCACTLETEGTHFSWMRTATFGPCRDVG